MSVLNDPDLFGKFDLGIAAFLAQPSKALAYGFVVRSRAGEVVVMVVFFGMAMSV